ncbi:hypothetical protein Tco_0540640 [Tanacetum coccineum]
MDPHTSMGRLCMDEHHKILLNDMVESKEDDVEPGVIFGRSFLRLTKAIVDFGNDILTIYPDLITFNFDSDDELDALLASINVDELPPLDISDFPQFVCNMGKNLRNKKKPSKTYKMSYDGEGPSLTINRLRTQKELTREEIEEDLYERIMILNERRPIIETLKYSDKHRTLLNGVLLDKLKLDREFELKDEMVGADLIKGYKAIKEKGDPRVFVLPIRRDEVKPRSDNVRMLDHLSAETMGCLLDVLYQVGVTTILVNFMLLDVLVDRDVPIIIGRSFLYTCGAIMNTIVVILNWLMAIYGVRGGMGVAVGDPAGVLGQWRGGVVEAVGGVRWRLDVYGSGARWLGSRVGSPTGSTKTESSGHGPKADLMDRALALQDALNPFKKIYFWKKSNIFFGALPFPLMNTEWTPNYSGNNTKEDGDGKWHAKIRVMDPYGNVFEQGYETKETTREMSGRYKLSDIMSPNWL